MINSLPIHMIKDLLSNIDCGIAIYSVDDSQKVEIQYLNDVVCQMAECERGKLLELAKKDILYTIDFSSREKAMKVFQKVLDEKCSAEFVFQSITYKGNHLWIRFKLNYVEQKETSDLIYGTFYDITSEVEASMELQRKYEYEIRICRENPNTLAYGMFNLKTHDTIELIQCAPLEELEYDMTLKQFRNASAERIVSDTDCEKFKEMFDVLSVIEKYEEGITTQSFEYQMRLSDGKVIWVRSVFKLFSKTRGTDLSLLYSCENINISKNIEIVSDYMLKRDYDILGHVNFQDESVIFLYGENSSHIQSGKKGVRKEINYEESLEWFINHSVIEAEREICRDKFALETAREKLQEQDDYEVIFHTLDEHKNPCVKKIRYANYDKEAGTCFFSQIDVTSMVREV